MSGPSVRRRRNRFGQWAELACIWSIRLRGYRVLARRFRVAAGEIDIIAGRWNVVAFIEVKARRNADAALEAVTPRQRRRIARAAELFISRRPDLAGHDMRFDIMVVVPWRLPHHLRDAWRS